MKVNKFQNQELFCKKYWERVFSKDCKTVDKLSQSWDIREVNQYLIGGYKPMGRKNIAGIIAATDKDFKLYKPIEKELILWRGICGAEIYKHPYMEALIEKCKKLKKGDILRMREYAFASDDKTYAQDIYTQDDGILYEITVPKGARIADDWNYRFPRESMFLCTQNDVVKENNKNFRLIKLTYLLPKSHKTTNKESIKKNFWSNIKNIILFGKTWL